MLSFATISSNTGKLQRYHSNHPHCRSWICRTSSNKVLIWNRIRVFICAIVAVLQIRLDEELRQINAVGRHIGHTPPLSPPRPSSHPYVCPGEPPNFSSPPSSYAPSLHSCQRHTTICNERSLGFTTASEDSAADVQQVVEANEDEVPWADCIILMWEAGESNVLEHCGLGQFVCNFRSVCLGQEAGQEDMIVNTQITSLPWAER